MKSLASIAEDFYHAFYKKEWCGDAAPVNKLSITEAYVVQDLVTRKRIKIEERVVSYKGGKLVTSAPDSEIMGSPMHSLRWLVNFLIKKGETLKKDNLVIPGSPVELVNIDQDTELKVAIEKVGSLTTRFKRKLSPIASKSSNEKSVSHK